MISAFVGDAPAKIILFGEHAVVYGQPAIAAPVTSLRVYASASENSLGYLRVIANELGSVYTITQSEKLSEKPLETICQLTLRHFNRPIPAVDLKLTSEIPIASGLGSGAAISAALARALAGAIGESLSDDVLNTLVYEVEKIHHGTPSGIDNTVIVYEQPIRYVRDEPIQRITLNHPFHFVIADTGIHAPTYLSVGDVRKLMDKSPETTRNLIEKIGSITDYALEALKSADISTVGRLMTENHRLLQSLTVSSPELDHLTDTALKSGAFGAKLSGGGRGGNMIALVESDSVESMKATLKSAGAYRVMDMTLGNDS
ncbi:MAG: mevalonate kinase [Aggregatilineales bacterium]